MSIVLPTGQDLDVIRESGTYLVTNPAGRVAGQYRVIVEEAADAAGNNYSVQFILNIGTGVQVARTEVEGGYAADVTVSEGATGPTGPAGATGPSGVGGGGGGISEEPVTSPDSVDPAEGEVRYQVTTGGSQAAEQLAIADGAYSGQRVWVELAVLTDPADSVSFDMTNIRINNGAPIFLGGTILTFTDASLEDPSLTAVSHSMMMEWDDVSAVWLVRYINPAPDAL